MVEIERDAYLVVTAMDAASALRFFGVAPSDAVAVDMGPAVSERAKPGARRWHVYTDRPGREGGSVG